MGRVTLTDHPGDLSWAVLRDSEKKLADGREVDGEALMPSSHDVMVFRGEELWDDRRGAGLSRPPLVRPRRGERPSEPLEQLTRVSTVPAELDTRYDALRREIIGRLSDAGLSRQAIGDVLDVPRQRVDELADAS